MPRKARSGSGPAPGTDNPGQIFLRNENRGNKLPERGSPNHTEEPGCSSLFPKGPSMFPPFSIITCLLCSYRDKGYAGSVEDLIFFAKDIFSGFSHISATNFLLLMGRPPCASPDPAQGRGRMLFTGITGNLIPGNTTPSQPGRDGGGADTREHQRFWSRNSNTVSI